MTWSYRGWLQTVEGTTDRASGRRKCWPFMLRCLMKHTRNLREILKLKHTNSSRTLAFFIWPHIWVKNCKHIVHQTIETLRSRIRAFIDRLHNNYDHRCLLQLTLLWFLLFLHYWIAACGSWAEKNNDMFSPAVTRQNACIIWTDIHQVAERFSRGSPCTIDTDLVIQLHIPSACNSSLLWMNTWINGTAM